LLFIGCSSFSNEVSLGLRRIWAVILIFLLTTLSGGIATDKERLRAGALMWGIILILEVLGPRTAWSPSNQLPPNPTGVPSTRRSLLRLEVGRILGKN
jgi:low temperature requirement protein LtrA